MGSMRFYTLMAWLLVMLATVTAVGVPLYPPSRTIRGFKNGHALSTARGFGKRADFDTGTLPSSLAETLQLGDRDSFPTDWFAEEVQNNGELARLIVQKFIDTNQDGELTADELLRPLLRADK